MNQLSGKIKSIYFYLKQNNYHIRHTGRRQLPGRGVRPIALKAFFLLIGYNNHMKISLPILYNPIKSMFDYPQIDTQKRRDFYVDFKYTFYRKSPYIMKNDEIPFEFMVQPPLPCCVDTHPVQDNNISFQQSLWGNL